jgi:protein required for attachment to host cells
MKNRRIATWALVTDGLRARILRGLEAGIGPPDPPTELIGQARARHFWPVATEMRTPAAEAGARSARDALASAGAAVRCEMHDFARDIAADLDRHRRAGDFRRLAVLAPPDVLPILRREMPRLLQDAVFLEHPVNLMRLGEGALRSAVIALIQQMDEGRAV